MGLLSGAGAAAAAAFALLVAAAFTARADDPYRFFTWTVTYGQISPLGKPQQGILINGQFPGPRLDCVTNDNIIINVINRIDEPLLLTWNGIKQRKNSWQDGVLGTNCPIPPKGNFTYKFQTKDQIGSFTYFPSTGMQKASGGFGALNVYSRPRIPVPYPPPAGDFSLLVGDWYKAGHKVLKQILDSGSPLPFADGLLINGVEKSNTFTGDQGKTYHFRISNVGLSTSINFRIQSHKLKLVEVEGSHTLPNLYDSLDIHTGQSLSVLVTLDQAPKDYYVVASTRFTQKILNATGVLHYSNSHSSVSGPIPAGEASAGVHWSMLQARSFRWNLTASAARPNPQGSYHYGNITRSRSIGLANSVVVIDGKLRYAVNGVSFVVPGTPLKLADNFNIPGVFTWDSIPVSPTYGAAVLGTPVLRFNLHEFIEIVFENNEKTIQSWHLDGYDFWVVGYGSGKWDPKLRNRYNLVDAVTRHTVQVYPNGWSAILVSLDNEGMWNLRSAMWARQYLGQQFYIRVWTAEKSYSNEYDMPHNALLCGKASAVALRRVNANPNEDTGISIQNCSLVASPELALSTFKVRTYLGRPWKLYATVVYIESFLDTLVDPAGWSKWSGERAELGLDTLYYGEYLNMGPGVATGGRVAWAGHHLIDYHEASSFSVSEFIYGDEWLGSTSFPYDSGI